MRVDGKIASVATGVVLLGLAIAHAKPAWACRFAPPSELAIDETAASPALPSAPVVGSIDIRRGGEEGGACSSSSCDDVGSVTVELDATDDTETVGFRFELVEGELPQFFSLPRTPVTKTSDGTVFLGFSDEDPAPFYARIAVTTVDIAGNESTEAAELELSDGQFEGCTAAGRAATGTLLPLLLALALVAGRAARA